MLDEATISPRSRRGWLFDMASLWTVVAAVIRVRYESGDSLNEKDMRPPALGRCPDLRVRRNEPFFGTGTASTVDWRMRAGLSRRVMNRSVISGYRSLYL